MFQILIFAAEGLGLDCLLTLLHTSPRVAVVAVAEEVGPLTDAAPGEMPDAILVVADRAGEKVIPPAEPLRAVWPTSALLLGLYETAGPRSVRLPAGYRGVVDLSGSGDAIATALIGAAALPVSLPGGGDRVGLEPEPASPIARLTRRETESLRHLALGLTSQDSGNRLGLKSRTIDTYRRGVARKLLGVTTVNLADLTRCAIAAGLIDPGAGMADPGGAGSDGSDGSGGSGGSDDQAT